MTKQKFPFNNFQFGEISPKFLGRFDTEEYQNACSKLENCVVGSLGGAFTRPGTEGINEIDVNQDIVFIPYELENGVVNFIWVYKDKPVIIEDGSTGNVYDGIGTIGIFGPFASAPSIEPISNPADLYDLDDPFSPSDFSYGKWQYVQYGKTVFVTHSSGLQKPFVITSDESTIPITFKLQYLVNYRLPQDGSGGHGTTPPDSDIFKRPYLDPNITPTTLNPSATSGSITITSSEDDVLRVGYVYKITHGSTTGAAIVTAINSATNADAEVILDFGASSATDNWQESAWGKNNWPKTFCVFEQRLFAGGSVESPDTVWGTVSGNVFNWMARKLAQDTSSDSSGLNYFGDLAATDAFFFRPASRQQNEIRWLQSSRSLAIGTAKGEYIADGGGDAIGPLAIRSKLQTAFGGGYAQSTQAGLDILFSTNDGKKLRTFRYSDENGSYQSSDISTIAKTVSAKVDQMEWNADNDIIWVIDEEGALSAVTFSDNFQRIAWSPQPFGADSSVTFLSVYSYGQFVYFLTKRGDVYSLEKLDLNHDPDTIDDCKYLDSYSVNTVASNFTNITATWLEDEEVYAFFEGEVYGPYTVGASGAITGLPDAFNGNDVLFGFRYKMIGTTVPLELGGEFGTAQGQYIRIDTILARLYKSSGGKIRGNESSNEDSIYGGGDLITDDVSNLQISQSTTRKNQVYFESSYGLPLNILAFVFEGLTNVK